jgi:amino acid transporter
MNGSDPATAATEKHERRSAAAGLVRTLTLTHAVLYGVGVTVGAGIYVLIGAAAAASGYSAPLAFVMAAVLMLITGASFAELASRMPVAAGEAAYVRAAFGSPALALAVGLLVAAIAIVSAAAISVGSAGYIGVFVPLPSEVIIAAVVLAMGAIAALGIRQSVSFAGLMTLIEIAGLLLIVLASAAAGPELITRLPEAVPTSLDPVAWAGVLSATLLAVFAFIGFESLANVAEEVENPQRTLPRAIFLTLALTTLLYVLVVWVALVAVGPGDLARSEAPLALVFERLTGASPRIMSAIAIVATVNGVIVQIIMASRVLYGLAGQGSLPPALGAVNPLTRTPLAATSLAGAAVLVLALFLPLERLAELTARCTLLLFAVVNAALIALKARDRESAPPDGIFVVPRWVPWAGVASTLALLVAEIAIWT